MKKITLALVTLLTISSAFAMPCVDLKSSLTKGSESAAVLSIQNYLFEKGFLTVKPNGYFGGGTVAAVKAYQNSIGLSSVGSVGPATRRALKNETCISQSPGAGASIKEPVSVIPSVKATSTPATPPKAVATPVPSMVTKTPEAERNEKRRTDIDLLLKMLARRFTDSRGVHPVMVTDTPIELCVVPKATNSTATATEVAVLVTAKSVCDTYVDVSYLSPSYVATIPRDPSISGTSPLLGYTITRDEYNNITLAAKNPEDKAIIKAVCNFSAGCLKVETISTVIYAKPSITSIDKPIFLRDSSPRKPINITGKGFTLKNKVFLNSSYSSKEYYLGEFASLDGLTLPITATSVNQLFPCGGSCAQKIPLGDYSLSIKNEGGDSNLSYLSVKGYTTSSFSARSDTSVTPKTSNVKLGTITVSSSVPLNLASLTFNSTSTSPNLAAKITKLTLKDPLTNTSVIAGGATFSLVGQSLYENQSKLYDVYADIGDVLANESGFISYGGFFVAKDILLGNEVELPVKEFSFSVSY